MNMNSYPLDTIMVILDGNETEYLRNVKEHYGENISWVVTNGKIGQVACYELAFTKLKSDFLLIIEDNAKFIRKRFI